MSRLKARALAPERTWRREDTERRGVETLAPAVGELTEMADAMKVVGRIVERVPSLLPNCLHAVIALPRPGGSLEAVAVGGPLSGAFRSGRRVTKGSLVNRVWQEQQATWATDLLAEPEPDEPELAERHRTFLRAGVRGYLALPLSVRGRTMGVLGMAFSQPWSFPGDVLATGQTFADQAALALENARLYWEAERRRWEDEVLAEISRTINASPDVHTVLRHVVEGARTLCRSESARIALREAESDTHAFRYWDDRQRGESAVSRFEARPGSPEWRALQSRRPVRAPAAEAAMDDASGEGLRAQLVVPIVTSDGLEGLLFVESRMCRPFTDLDESALVRLAEHAAVAIRKAQLFADAEAAGRRLQTVSRRLLQVQEAERRHLSRELHDEVGQALTAMRMNLQTLRQPALSKRARERLDESITLVDRILHGVRQLALDLRPSLLDDLGLAAAVRWYVSTQAERAGLLADVVTEPLPPDLPPSTTITCFRVTQEAITNIIRHARAARIAVNLRCAAHHLEVSIVDDGIGFDVATARAGASAGLLGLEERVELAGGRCRITSGPGRGTSLRAWLPTTPPSPSVSQVQGEESP